MNIAVDIDDTLNHLDDTRVDFALEYAAKHNLQVVDKDAHYFKHIFGCTDEQAKQFFYTAGDDFLFNANIKKNAAEVITKLKEEGHKIIIITARTKEWHKDPEKMSIDWLNKHSVPFDKFCFNSFEKTSHFIKENIDVVIDDSLFVFEEAKALNIPVLLMHGKHNKHFEDDGCIRVFSWDDVYVEIQKILKAYQEKK